MRKIKFKLIKFHKQILFQIIEQSGFEDNIEAEVNTKIGLFKIKTCSEPEIRIDDCYEGNMIFLRGYSKGKDKIVNIVNFDGHNIDDVYSSIIEALSKVNKINFNQYD